VTASHGDPRQMWRMTKNLFHSNPPCTLDDDQCQTMSSTLCTFFMDKVNRIHASIMTTVQSLNNERFQSRNFNGQPMDSLSDVVPSDVLKLISKLPNKSSPRDVLPTSLLLSCADVFSPVIANPANISFRTGEFSSTFKTAQVLTLLKKPGLDQHVSANYRPISNLYTMSKIIGRLVLVRLKPHLLNFSPQQSAYYSGHSTETALQRILNGFYKAIDDKKLTVMISLDISAALDTVNHSKLLSRFRDEFGVTDMALKRFKSYIEDQQQFVKFGRYSSATVRCTSGVPQGSVFGPLIFATYVSPIGEVISSRWRQSTCLIGDQIAGGGQPTDLIFIRHRIKESKQKHILFQ
jgi:Reverse transcriptase (RNA-dependent DNA polymerase)